jgi:hypothetical protein
MLHTQTAAAQHGKPPKELERSGARRGGQGGQAAVATAKTILRAARGAASCRVMPPSAAHRARRTACCLILVLAAVAVAQITPDAPIRNFRLPMFGDDGYKSWELRGFEGVYLRDGAAEIIGMDLLVYRGGATLALDTRIRAPLAVIEFDAARAHGEATLQVDGEGFAIEGRDWLWEGREQRITVREDVAVSFFESLIILE